MANFSKSALKYQYSWARTERDSKETGFPDNVLLNRSEGYEILYFLNKYMTERGLTSIEDFHTLEKRINQNVPSHYHSHAKIKQWLDANIN
jgi:hypothetical protein